MAEKVSGCCKIALYGGYQAEALKVVDHLMPQPHDPGGFEPRRRDRPSLCDIALCK
jgi:hypothetical protein